MHIKKFTGSTVKDAIKAIKAEFGEDALILSTKRIQTGLYEVIASVDYDLATPVTVDLKEAAKVEKKGAGKAKGNGKANEADWITPAVRDELRDLRELKEFCLSIMSQSKTRASQIFMELEEEMVKRGVDKTLAQKILMNTFKGVPREKTQDIGFLKLFMRNKMMEKIDVTDPLAMGGCIAFIGPPGVGKTTTIAKLAAIYMLRKKRSIALLTMDTYRIAAVEQLKVYGRIIGASVEVANSARELASFIDLHRDKDLVLIDTAGRSQKNSSHIKELSEMARACPEVKFNLVLNSQTRDEGLYDAVRAFSAVAIDSITFTKLDEGNIYGPILNTIVLARKPLAYLTTGQRVPEDIELASKERLLNFCMPN